MLISKYYDGILVILRFVMYVQDTSVDASVGPDIIKNQRQIYS